MTERLYWTQLKECRQKKSLSFPPPWEFQTRICTSRASDPFLLLGDPGLLINLPRNWLSQFQMQKYISGKYAFYNLHAAFDYLCTFSMANVWSVQSWRKRKMKYISKSMLLCLLSVPSNNCTFTHSEQGHQIKRTLDFLSWWYTYHIFLHRDCIFEKWKVIHFYLNSMWRALIYLFIFY